MAVNRSAALRVIGLATIVAFGCKEASAPTDTPEPMPGGEERGFGAFNVVLTETGTPADSGGYVFIATPALGGMPQRLTARTGERTLSLPNVRAGAHTLQLNALSANCMVVNTNPRPVSIADGQVIRVEFAVFCHGSDQLTFDRTDASTYSSTERYELDNDGRFLLKLDNLAFPGWYARTGDDFTFKFDARSGSNGQYEWVATAAFDGRCLTVRYNAVMSLTDFEDGQFCALR